MRSLLILLGLALASAGAAAAQTVSLPVVEPLHQERLVSEVERDVHGALLASDDETRDAYLDAAEQIALHLVASDSTSADAVYWLAVTQGIRTEHSNPFQKLTRGKEVFFTTARILELDSLHAGGHEMMGRLHAAVMRLPWLVRKLALSMGMGDALGEASWERAEEHFRRSCELDPAALAARLELAKLYLRQGRVEEAGPVLDELTRLSAASEVDRRIQEEGTVLLEALDSAEGGGARRAPGP